MLVVGALNGESIYAMPSDEVSGVRAPSTIEWEYGDKVAETASDFNYQSQVIDWMQSMWLGVVSLPPLDRYSNDFWTAWMLSMRHGVGLFMLGDPKGKRPKGPALGMPLVSGAGQTGYSVATSGWKASVTGILLPGDYLQIGYRLYKVRDSVSSDSSGNATIPIWPNLRDQPADQVKVVTRACKGVFRLRAADPVKSSVNVGSYGVTAFNVREAV